MIEQAFLYLQEELSKLLGNTVVTKIKGSMIDPRSSTARFEVWTVGNRLQLRLTALVGKDLGDEEVRSIPLSEWENKTVPAMFPEVLTHDFLIKLCFKIWQNSPYATQITDLTLGYDKIDSDASFETPDGWMFLKVQPQIITP